MKFDENDKVELDSINRLQAVAYISFLYAERSRHIVNAEEARRIQDYCILSNDYSVAWVEFWKSAERRHLKDIEMINLRIKEVQKRFGLEEK